jgi:protein SCO1/2
MGLALAGGGVGAVAARELGPLVGEGREWHRPEPARAAIQRRHLPNVSLVTHEGYGVRFYDDLVRDKKVLINFVDTRNLPTASVVTENLALLQRFLRNRVGGKGDISMYSITSNPRHDTPEVLGEWARRHGARPGWLFLTGEPAEVETLRRALGFAYADPADDADPSAVGGILKHGNEAEMRWAHCQSQADPRQVALRIVADFGPDPAVARDPQWFCNDTTIAPLR